MSFLGTTIRGADARTRLGVYLRDHLAGALAGTELGRRAWRNNRGGPLGSFLRELLGDVQQDRAALERIMDHLDVPPSSVKDAAAIALERVGRLKLNGQLLGYSPLSRLVELEGLAVGIDTKLNLWRSLQAALPPEQLPADVDLESLIARAQQQRADVERHRQQAAREALS